MDTSVIPQNGPFPTPTAEQQDPHCLHPDQAASLLATAPWRRLTIVGDSIALGVGDPVDGYLDLPWAHRLAQALTAAVGPITYRNRGVQGQRMKEIVATQLAPALADSPDLAVVTGGANDMLRRSVDWSVVSSHLDTVLGRLHNAGALVVTFGLLDLSRTRFVPDAMRSDLHDRLARLNDITRAATDRCSGVHVDFFDHPALDESLFSADMLHPNRRGHAVIAADTIRALAERVRRP